MHCKRILRPTFETDTPTHERGLSLIVSLSTATLEKPLSCTKPPSAGSLCSAFPRGSTYRISDASLEVSLSASKEAEDPGANVPQHTEESFSWNTGNFSSCTVFHFSQRMRIIIRTPHFSVRHKQRSHGFRSGDHQSHNQRHAEYLLEGSHRKVCYVGRSTFLQIVTPHFFFSC
jgi:hypothetical protein